MDLADCVDVDLACFTGDDDGVDGPRNEASRAAMPSDASDGPYGSQLSHGH